ncbi:MAG UNVERIFIED_CONTAM: methylenetetrahydrofolate reductase C-terminal domain-containing protein [Anaerolineae bacterium]
MRQDGHCEVKPEMPCVWLQAWERSAKMTIDADDIMIIQPPLDRRQEGKSAFINMVEADKRWTAPPNGKRSLSMISRKTANP